MLTPFATDAQIADRSARAVAAAAAAGRDLGLDVQDPTALYDVFSVVAHLAPAPVVVRVPTVLPRTLTAEAQADQQRRELAVTGWLHEQGFPVVPPSPLVPAEPVHRDGFSMTLWQHVTVTDAEDCTSRPELAAELYATLRGYPGPLPWLVPLDASIPDGFDQLDGRPDLLAPADLSRARHEWSILHSVLGTSESFARAFPGVTPQPVHGDAPTYNMLATPDGLLCADFEHVTLGVPEWDLVGISDEDRAAYDKAAERLGLRPLDDRLLEVMAAARAMQLVACLALAPQLPMLVEGLRPWVDQWRETSIAGGLEIRT
jgi:hypothetical protein